MRILVTGGAGFIGSHIVDALVARGHQVFVLDNLSTGKKRFVNTEARFFLADVRNRKRVTAIFRHTRPEAVFHLAAQLDVRKSVADPNFDAEVNVLGALNVLEECVRCKTKKFIFSSTGGALYGEASVMPTPESYPTQPISPYGVAKRTVEHYLQYYQKEYGLETISLRYANVYGPRQNAQGEAGVVAIFCSRLIHTLPLVINGDGRQTRDYVYVADVVDANIRALRVQGSGAYNIGTGVETSVNELAKRLRAVARVAAPVVHGPAKHGEQRRSVLDCKRATRALGWKPRVSLEYGLAKTFRWFQENA